MATGVPATDSMTEPVAHGPVPRTVHFDFERPMALDWLAGSVAGSTLLNGYTILFPALETIMIRELASVETERAGLAGITTTSCATSSARRAPTPGTIDGHSSFSRHRGFGLTAPIA